MRRALRDLIRQRASGRCEYCRLPEEFSELHFHLEHITPRQHGGGDGAGNRALACPECNLRKGPNLTAIDSVSRRIVRLFQPRRDKWDRHFGYAGARVVGKTAMGRATISLLGMNAPERLRVRELLLELGILD